MKYCRTLLILVLLAFNVNCASAANGPAQIEKPEYVVASLYRDFGWELFMTDYYNSTLLIDQPVTVLKRYFTPELAKLIAKNRQYEIKTKEVGNAEFEYLCGSQDPDGISNIRIDRKPGTDIVTVLYDQNGEKDVMRIDFYTTHTQKGWRISDIHYNARKSIGFPHLEPESSLFDSLSQPYY